MQNVAFWLRAVLASPKFFWAVIIFFVLEALWFVFFAAYPMAYDENTHFWLIQIYASQWHPFFSQQPAMAEGVGVVPRDPSYLYYYIMSFPYRLISLITGSLAAKVIFLRLLNVAMFTGGLLLFARVLRRAGTSKALTNTALAIFALVPIVPFLAAHINYDNMVFLLLPALLLLAFQLHDGLRERRVSVAKWLLFFIGCFIITAVKFAAAVLLVPVVAYLLYTAVRAFRGRSRELTPAIRHGARRMGWPLGIGLAVAFAIAFGLFFQRSGVNLIKYGNFNPGCTQVISLEQCLQFGPFARNYHVRQNSEGDFNANPVTYAGIWLKGMWHRSFFAISGEQNMYENDPGLPAPKYTAIVLAVAGALAVITRFRATFRGRPLLQILGLMSIFYIAVLFTKLYTGIYSETGYPAAINGRYLIPTFLPLAAVMGRAFSLWLRKLSDVKPYLATAAILLFLYGGGVFSYIIRSEKPWMWQNQFVIESTEIVRQILSSFIWH